MHYCSFFLCLCFEPSGSSLFWTILCSCYLQACAYLKEIYVCRKPISPKGLVVSDSHSAPDVYHVTKPLKLLVSSWQGTQPPFSTSLDVHRGTQTFQLLLKVQPSKKFADRKFPVHLILLRVTIKGQKIQYVHTKRS